MEGKEADELNSEHRGAPRWSALMPERDKEEAAAAAALRSMISKRKEMNEEWLAERNAEKSRSRINGRSKLMGIKQWKGKAQVV